MDNVDNVKKMNNINLSETVVKLENVARTYKIGENEVHALRGVSFEIKQGEFLAIMGPSGSGKSTCMNLIGCLDVPTSGSYILAGRDMTKCSDNQLADVRNRELGSVFQSFHLANLQIQVFYNL